ncbi:hypothetical protein J1N35_011758 [Gossypium stocksii]|uniref:Uncharacterized protein n=1 Tax=Gossypium stocksii TaxID=47602 RepID=A0A9D3W4M5_9ROSI|nr:hypothetical protein J1N35_011758 [Gossypium stocksii]
MQYPEIQAAVYALRNTRGLPWPNDHKRKKDEDILDWLQEMFGFQIQAAVYALRNTRGLPWPNDYKRKKDEDILDWLQEMFGFQKDNVANQREHLILLLANVHIRRFPKPD